MASAENVDTAMNTQPLENLRGLAKVDDMLESLQPRTGRLEKVAAAALFLTSHESSLVAGTSSLVHAGLTGP